MIFIDDFYVGDTTYVRGNYRHINYLNSKISGKNYEDFEDTNRRINTYKKFMFNKSVCDFGCGTGNFLKSAKVYAKRIVGIEIEKKMSRKFKKKQN